MNYSNIFKDNNHYLLLSNNVWSDSLFKYPSRFYHGFIPVLKPKMNHNLLNKTLYVTRVLSGLLFLVRWLWTQFTLGSWFAIHFCSGCHPSPCLVLGWVETHGCSWLLALCRSPRCLDMTCYLPSYATCSARRHGAEVEPQIIIRPSQRAPPSDTDGRRRRREACFECLD